jgi:hypothetical protein
MTRSIRFAAVVSVLVVGLQALTFVTGSLVWPFFAYCMYSKAITIKSTQGLGRKVFATLDDGSTIRLDYNDVGIGKNVWKQDLTRDIETPEVIERLRRAVRANTGREITGLEMHVVNNRLKDGVVYTDVNIRQIEVPAEAAPKVPREAGNGR